MANPPNSLRFGNNKTARLGVVADAYKRAAKSLKTISEQITIYRRKIRPLVLWAQTIEPTLKEEQRAIFHALYIDHPLDRVKTMRITYNEAAAIMPEKRAEYLETLREITKFPSYTTREVIAALNNAPGWKYCPGTLRLEDNLTFYLENVELHNFIIPKVRVKYHFTTGAGPMLMVYGTSQQPEDRSPGLEITIMTSATTLDEWIDQIRTELLKKNVSASQSLYRLYPDGSPGIARPQRLSESAVINVELDENYATDSAKIRLEFGVIPRHEIGDDKRLKVAHDLVCNLTSPDITILKRTVGAGMAARLLKAALPTHPNLATIHNMLPMIDMDRGPSHETVVTPLHKWLMHQEEATSTPVV